MIEKLIPENDLESLLIKAQNSEVGMDEFLQSFLEFDIAVPSESEILPDGSGMAPLIFDKNGSEMIGVFTSLSRAAIFKDKAPYCLSLKAKVLIERIPESYGIVVNPGFDKGFELPAYGVAKLRQ